MEEFGLRSDLPEELGVKGSSNGLSVDVLHHPLIADRHNHAIGGVGVNNFAKGMLEGCFEVRSRPSGATHNFM
jgi:hypothetical protein